MSDNRTTGPGDDPDVQAVSEFLDQHHPRASLHDGDKIVIDPGKVLENIAFAMERVDNDIDTPVSIEEDVAPVAELISMIQNLRMGPALVAHLVNTAMKITSVRYPAELVRAPFPPQYDLRKLLSVTFTDQEHQIAKTIFDRRSTSASDLTGADVAADLEPLDVAGQMQVFVALFFMFGTKVGEMKHRTGIE